LSCGHETIITQVPPSNIVNDPLDIESVSGFDLRDRFQQEILLKCPARDFLVDIGSGSGRFLYINRQYFKSHLGVEITPACIEFSQKQLGLTVSSELPTLSEAPSVVSMWHSLEHLSFEVMVDIFKKISGFTNTWLIVSVPNGDSIQARLFGHNWAYYDYPAHLRQFSPRSLESFMSKQGFTKTDSYYSFWYILSGWVLSLLNLITPGHNYFYYSKKRRQQTSHLGLDVLCYLALIVIIPLSVALALLEFACPSKRSVLTAVFKTSNSLHFSLSHRDGNSSDKSLR
jgi:hypothetical protein